MRRLRRPVLTTVVGAILSLFCVLEVNLSWMTPSAGRALFALLGLYLCYLENPLAQRWAGSRLLAALDHALGILAAGCCAYVMVEGKALGQRAGLYTTLDIVVGVIGIVLVLEATRRSIGWTLPVLALFFIVYALVGPHLPRWLFPHRGYDVARIVGQTFLRTEGVFGTALSVMFTYVFLFVLFGAFLSATGATGFIIDVSKRLFGRSTGGPAKIAVASSGLLGSLSGSAVANAVTSGTFTIPLMRSAGFSREVAGGISAAAASGGALVPPVMGAGAYMMLEIIDPPVTYLQIVRAAILPAVLYYFSLFCIVHFYARRQGVLAADRADRPTPSLAQGIVFCSGLLSLIGLLVAGYSPYRSATVSLVILVVLGLCHPKTRIGPRKLLDAFVESAQGAVALIAASACVGIIIGIVILTGVGTAFPSAIVPLAEHSLFLALVAIMACSLVLGMGLPSAVCYLLLATLVGPVLGRLGVPVLAAHLFIFYFGLMSMVTPPVALAAYATASLAGADIMRTGLAAFRFSLVGFTLPYMFVYRPELLLLGQGGEAAPLGLVVVAVMVAVAGIVALAAAIAGQLHTRLGVRARVLLLVAAGLLLFPGTYRVPYLCLGILDIAGGALLAAIWIMDYRRRAEAPVDAPPSASAIPAREQ